MKLINRNERRTTYFCALNFEFHVILARRLAVLALLPTVAVATVAHLFARVEQHGPTLWPSFQHKEPIKRLVAENEIESNRRRRLPDFDFFKEPFRMTVKVDQDGSNFLSRTIE